MISVTEQKSGRAAPVTIFPGATGSGPENVDSIFLMRGAIGLALLVLLCSAPLRGDNSLFTPTPQTDPTEFGSLALDPSEALLLDRGEWFTSVQTSYFNQWAGTWHTARFHLARNEPGPFTDEDIRTLESQFPQDNIFRLDIEGWRSDLVLARGLPGGATLNVRIPWVEIGGPHWDQIGEAFHDVFGETDSYRRDLFARGDTFVLFRTNKNISITAREELERSGVGDATVALAMPLPSRWFGTQSVAVSLKVPTGERGTLHGSGGWDSGARWFAVWNERSREYLMGLGYNKLDGGGNFLGVQRNDSWNVLVGVRQPITRRLSASVRSRVDSSPLRELEEAAFGRATFYHRLGLSLEARDQTLITFEFGNELVPQAGIDADWSFHLGVTKRFHGSH